MSTTLLAEYHRTAVKGHVCQLCFRAIEPGARYLDQRCAEDGSAWTFKCHEACNSAYWSWVPHWDNDSYTLIDLSGHLPPCPLAWNIEEWKEELCICSL